MDQLLTVQVVQSDGYLVYTALCYCFRKTDLEGQRKEKHYFIQGILQF